jgi:hypothetical protein
MHDAGAPHAQKNKLNLTSHRVHQIITVAHKIEKSPTLTAAHSFPNMSRIPAEPYLWPHDGELSSTTALVIIDMQNDCESCFGRFFFRAVGNNICAVCSPGGYLDHQGYPLEPMRAPIPHISRLLNAFRKLGWPVFHTREGHRADMSDVSARELFRSRNNLSGLGMWRSNLGITLVLICGSFRHRRPGPTWSPSHPWREGT